MNRRTLLLLWCAITFGGVAVAASSEVGVRDAWVRANVPGQDTAAAYMKLTSSSPITLVRAESPLSRSVELHSMRLESGVMRMRSVAQLELPAGKTIELAPSGMHLMLVGISQSLKVGDTVPITLTFQSKSGSMETVQVGATVEPMTASGPKAPAGHGH